MSIAVVIVTYNRKKLLVENLNMLLKQTAQLDSVIIIDNASSDGTQRTLEEQGFLNNPLFDYVLMKENTGGAGGFSYGVEYAMGKGFDWIILMDDDGKPANEHTITQLLEHGYKVYNSTNKNVAINALVTYDGKNTCFEIPYTPEEVRQAQHSDVILVDASMPFNCTMFSKEVIAKAGIPRADFFMSCDEREYMARVKRTGAFIGIVPTAIYLHPRARDIVVEYKNGLHELFENPRKEYYYIRNNVALHDKHIKCTIDIFLKRIILIMKYEDQKYKRLIYCTKAIVDGLTGRMGKRL